MRAQVLGITLAMIAVVWYSRIQLLEMFAKSAAATAAASAAGSTGAAAAAKGSAVGGGGDDDNDDDDDDNDGRDPEVRLSLAGVSL